MRSRAELPIQGAAFWHFNGALAVAAGLLGLAGRPLPLRPFLRVRSGREHHHDAPLPVRASVPGPKGPAAPPGGAGCGGPGAARRRRDRDNGRPASLAGWGAAAQAHRAPGRAGQQAAKIPAGPGRGSAHAEWGRGRMRLTSVARRLKAGNGKKKVPLSDSPIMTEMRTDRLWWGTPKCHANDAAASAQRGL